MVTLIVGRTASGKSTLAKMLEDMGAKILKSYTTREQRNESDTDHIFITKEEAKTFSHKVATTVINGNEYFATLEQFEDSDFYIIDPCGIETFLKTMPNTKFEVIYVDTKKKLRKERFMERGATEEDFLARDNAENEQFTDFEIRMGIPNGFPVNVSSVFVVNNNSLETLAMSFIYKYFLEQTGRIIKHIRN